MQNPDSKIPGLTTDVMRTLYEINLLTETQIAQKFGCNQVYVGRLRQAMGIPSKSKGDRLELTLPPLTEEQIQVLIGSLLGDGSLGATSAQSARFTESHSLKQQDYLRWKADIFGSYLAAVIPVKKQDKKTGRVFHGVSMTTKACPQLRSYYDLFYPAPLCKRVFPADLTERMTPLVFAVWYMDDGSVSSTGAPRIAFGLDDLSLVRACLALQNFGLNPVVYGAGGEQSIEFPGQTDLVKSLLGTQMPPNMAYKMPFELLGKAFRAPDVLLAASREAVAGLPLEQQVAVFHEGRNAILHRQRQDNEYTAGGLLDHTGFTKDILTQMYIQHTDANIGKMCGVPEGTIRELRKKLGVSLLSSRQRRELDRPADQASLDDLTDQSLRALYVQKSIRQIAELYHVQSPAIRRLMLKWGIPAISKSERVKARRDNPC